MRTRCFIPNQRSILLTSNHVDMSHKSDTWGLTPAELRKLRGLKTPHGIQRVLDDMPYHLEDSAWSPRRVLRENTSHCYEGALFAAAALRVIGYPPLILDLEAVHDTDHVIAVYQVEMDTGVRWPIELHRMPLSRAGVSFAARTGAQLFRYLLQFARRADVADFFAARAYEAIRSSALDDFGRAGLVCGGVSAHHFTLRR